MDQFMLDRRQRNRDELLLMGDAIWFLYLRRNQRFTRRIWTRDWLQRRDDLGAFDTLVSELREEDQGSFLNFFRMSPGLFDELLTKVTPLIQREDTRFRKAISPGMRLSITLRYLATGDSFKSLSYLFRVANNTIGLIIPETCKALYDVLHEEYFQCPSTESQWKEVAKEYQRQWQFPNCIGSIDGKHIAIRKPTCSGAQFFNYKHHFSAILLAVVDANYKFIFCDIGAQGRCSDAGIYADCDLQDALKTHTLGLPGPTPLPGTNIPFPYCLIGDDAFPLSNTLLKPYPHRNLDNTQRIYNYRLSRARRCVENAFGIMSSRFRVLLHPICLQPAKVDYLILACCALHNLLRTVVPNKYVCHQDTEGQQTTSDQVPQALVAGRRSATQAGKDLREKLSAYFVSKEGAVPWQNNMI